MRSKRISLLAVGLAFVAVAATISSEANAASAICRQLEGQLANAGSRGGNGRVEGYIGRQRAELRKARGQLRSAGCSFFTVGGQCSSIRSVIGRMENNLANLESRPDRRGSPRSRARILAALDANGCRRGSPQKQMVAERDNNESMLSAFFPREERRRQNRREREQTRVASLEDRPWAAQDERDRKAEDRNRRSDERRSEFRSRSDGERKRDAESARQSVGAVYGGETFQTMCVRMTDGYYFPVSPASSRNDFKRDRNNCQAMCPGVEVSIYYKQLDSDEMDGMVSADNGRPYRSLSTAYRYRDMPRVGCSGDRKTAMLATVESQAKTVDFEFPVPSPKPGSNNTIPLWVGSMDAAVATLAPTERSVRVVGPVYLPDQPAAETQPVPVQTPAP